MNLPQNSQDSPGSMGEAGGYWDGFVNGDDSFHNVINMLDFPLESVEEDKCVAEENWDAQFPSLGPFSSEIVQEFTPVFRSDFTEDVPYSFIENDAASDRKLLPVTEFSSTNFSLDSFHPRNLSLLQTPSQNSVLESSSSCSAGKNLSTSCELLVPVRARTKIPRSLTFTRWHLLSPLTPPRKILHSEGKEKKNMQPSQHSNEFDMKEDSYPQHMPYKRCTHCQAEKTPQWRAGPMGPNTLCNACGVCYRKRKHLPTYRLISSHSLNTEKCSFTRGKEKKINLSSEIKEDLTNQLPEDCEIAEDLTYQLPCKRCTLCNVTKTPQQREGPVCNARGVRSQSGRLLRESLPSPDPEEINTKKREKKKELSGVPNDSGAMGFATHQPMQVRRCTHCQVSKTPQWREGPNGPRTLCNACGVRYRSGRLVPEYRPAASPTFTPYLHSNKHRKVIEMRKKASSEFSV
ncbi:GATA transcription factor 11-like [Daucus carota subsp. sativus]|uniref:GATA transcription factor 11-like n=1 Tax=Daucus carota subsp. sativus TaxID=79200 RepID=UPI0007EF077E|nr:PREDICTED: GATA transcription factor 11-like [Daucus carota subsp. sativus]